ncbi:transcriptional regulator, LacI family [Paenibacillus sp. UNCCL117]|uniref:LacI family DNA-binding transcriptional regulator n=1 Tax=unclassified Paenibacillus TaxID=185978 RepID=UPI00088BFD04|nr:MULTISPECIES: LacI family DNA-binding transcriptional regulator [unclassified Paenibacillus]SDD15767.1 DNA-binding transcriptional regulator, LacI/PurR family [Paenibacillus sp. cl123]SFW34532.1 transcriptional regulator, LacI family [Paenibacillus sp. UNCCL117]
MANIKQIAQAAGVSVTTVSRVLNGHPYVSEAKREAVQAAVEALDYARNANAVHLIKGKTNMIGVMLPYVNHAYFGALVEGIGHGALQNHVQLLLCQTNYEPDKELEVLEMLKMKQLDGLVICSKASSWDIIRAYTGWGPIVACEDVGELPISAVYVDHYGCFELGIRYLIRKGHRRIGYCLSRTDSSSGMLRREAYLAIMNELGEPVREQWMFSDCIQMEDGARVVGRLLDMEERPTALLVAGDTVAAGILAEAERCGLRVPEDLAVIGLDNQPIARVLGITTIDNQLDMMGEAAFRLLHDQVTGRSERPQKRELSCRLLERRTV